MIDQHTLARVLACRASLASPEMAKFFHGPTKTLGRVSCLIHGEYYTDFKRLLALMALAPPPSFGHSVKTRRSVSRDSSGLRTEALDAHKSARKLWRCETSSNQILMYMVRGFLPPQTACFTVGRLSRPLATFYSKIQTVMLLPSSAPPGQRDTRLGMSMVSFTSSPRLAHAP